MTEKDQYQIQKLWQKAHTANLMAVNDPTSMEVFGAFAITEDTPLIFSRLPREDYEIGDADIRQFKTIYARDDEGMMADYFKLLRALDDYILDEQYNSVLIRPMSYEEITAVFEKVGFTTITKNPSTDATE